MNFNEIVLTNNKYANDYYSQSKNNIFHHHSIPVKRFDASTLLFRYRLERSSLVFYSEYIAPIIFTIKFNTIFLIMALFYDDLQLI